jgi:ATP-binding cassette subfamily B protein/ATP-binding cassette subfamily C protein
MHRADWIVLLEQGKIQLQGSLEAFIAQPGEHLHFLTI